MRTWKITTAALFIAMLSIPTILGAIPLSLYTPVGTVSTKVQEAEARARNTTNNRLSNLLVPTSGGNLNRVFSPTHHSYIINLHQDRTRVGIEPRRDNSGQSIRHRIDTRRDNGTWNNGNWSRWRSGTNVNNRINVDLNRRGLERRVRLAVRDRDGNVRTYTVQIRRASANTWGASLTTNAGTFNRSFARNVTNYTLALPHNRENATIRMTSERPRSAINTRVGNGNWSNTSHGSRARTVTVPQGGTRVVQFRIRGPFSHAAPSPTHQRIYTVTVNRARPPAPAPAPNPAPNTNGQIPTFTFSGSGWGHGVGMSQHGAMQQSREGRSANQILQHYYTGITVADRAPRGNMRVNLDAGRANRTNWTIGPRTGQTGSTMSIGNRTFNGANGPYVFTVRNGNIRMTPRTGSVVDFGSSIRITSNGSGGNQRSVTQLLTVMDQSGPPLPSASHRFVRYRGTLELTVVDGRLRLVNELPMQQYLFGVVPREIPSSAAVRTAVEAQAIAARSFAHGQTGLAQGVHSTTTFQVYGGNSRFSSEANWRSGSNVIFNEIDVSNTAVTNTGNRVILSNGNIARAYYSLCNADRTANNEDVWGGTRVAHLRSVADPFCGRDRNHPHNWTVTMTGMELANTLRLRGSTVPNGAGSTVFVTNLSSDRATGGWVRTLTVTWSNGTTTQIGNADRVRTRLGFRSSNFSVARSFPTARATVAPLASSEIMPMMSMDLLLEEALEELEMGDYSPFEITQEMRNYEEDCENSMSCQGTEETVRE